MIWDFNGTILDDVDLAVGAMNAVLNRRGLPAIDAQDHKKSFGHPVSDYYSALGIDLAREDLSLLSDEFHDGYLAGVSQCRLVEGVSDLLSAFQDRGIRQFVLSAAEQTMLDAWVRMLGIEGFFTGVYGLADRLAVTKVLRGQELQAAHDVCPGSTLLIGDTDHDVEVAEALGCVPVVVALGHQGAERFEGSGARVFDSFRRLGEELLTATTDIQKRRAVRAVLLTPEESVLLVCALRRGDGKQLWFAPGGGLEPGETHMSGLRRELFEETGLDLNLVSAQIGPPVWTRHHEFDWGPRRISQHETYYVIRIDAFTPISSGNPDQEELATVQQHRWMTTSQMRAVSGTLVPARLPELVESLLSDGPPDPPIDAGL
ncbi:MAG: NUDIX domain-containing protein [Gemmatimonadetes bacterium]|nr:NUDIX domain-containing protein [Gemmatimonadota bacterium]MBT6143821.1 NUDIX domain-containing protein [Gemmatimonadota bacterium]MBT7859852.1 NUDIX domain-containing protein [Gemmatimonadota bacterium]